jgi:MEMO1 family protein
MASIRATAVAGLFYPNHPVELRRMVQGFLSPAPPSLPITRKAIIAPHAGYVYSGPIAGSAYAALSGLAGQINRVLLLGPSHTLAFRGLAAPDADFFATPLGDLPVDRTALSTLSALPQVQTLNLAHTREHGLEVHLPFLQVVLGSFKLVPLVVGEGRPAEVAEVLQQLWGGPETLIVISSDLSHYQDYATAQQLDATTAQAIEGLKPEAIDRDGACGRLPIQGLLLAARKRHLVVHRLDLRNSGDTAGPKDRVVGYGAWLLGEKRSES